MTDSHSPAPPILTLPKTSTQIRPFHTSSSEYATLAAAANNTSISKNMRNGFPSPYTIESSETWISFVQSQSQTTDFAISLASTNELIGAIGLKPKPDVYYRSMELGYWISEEHWGKGIAGEAVPAFCEWVFGEFKNVLRIEAEVFDGNEGSRRVLEKAGFVAEGRKKWAVEKNGVVLDVWVYALLRDGGVGEP
ncbi:acyl-CoA N-acyltransferase [Aspergillus crustosus]